MTVARCAGKKRKYSILDAGCIGRTCFQPGEYQHRGATLSGSRNTGDYSDCCMYRAYHGCPTDKTVDADLLRERKKEGWKVQ
jgi:hypothetical protein